MICRKHFKYSFSLDAVFFLVLGLPCEIVTAMFVLGNKLSLSDLLLTQESCLQVMDAWVKLLMSAPKIWQD